MLAISAFARDEAVELVGVAPERITVVHSGPGFAEAPSAGSRRRQTPTRPYALFVGNLTASKNLPFLIRAFGAASAPELLVLAGRPLERYDEIEAEIATSPRRDQILVLHDVDDAELASLYTHAVLLALPSKYEGFGLTALEAMQHGCPVLVSDIPALREISGAGALVLPVGDAESWTGALERVATDPTFRDSLRVRGTQTVAGYSWQSTARGLCEMFRDVPLSSAR
jgi:glycosyltransferase involved in cell wall biosynthesis